LKDQLSNSINRCPNKFRAYLWGIESEIHDDVSLIEVVEFRAYLWGIERLLSEVGGAKQEEFRAYLWGIERKIPYQAIRKNRLYLELTYEGLKGLREGLIREYAPPFRAYLWGIERNR